MNFYEIIEKNKVVEPLPGFDGIYIQDGETDGLYELFALTDGFKTSESTPEELKEHTETALRMMFKYFLVDGQGNPFEEMIGEDANYGKVPPSLLPTAVKFVTQRAVQGKNLEPGTN